MLVLYYIPIKEFIRVGWMTVDSVAGTAEIMTMNRYVRNPSFLRNNCNDYHYNNTQLD